MGECPTTRALELCGAELLGFEDAMFVPTGTQANLCAVGTHCTRGDEVILGSKSHIYLWEAGSTSALLGASTCVIPNDADGTFDLAAAERGIRVRFSSRFESFVRVQPREERVRKLPHSYTRRPTATHNRAGRRSTLPQDLPHRD